MKILKIVGGVAVIALLAIFGFALYLPSTATVERSTVMQGGIDDVFTYVNSLERRRAWSPWTARDRNMHVEFSGPARGIGAQMTWRSDVPEVGSGTQTIVRAEQNQFVESDIEFGDQGGGRESIKLAPIEDGVRVTWSYTADFSGNLIARYFGLALDGMLAPYFEHGLSELQLAVESSSAITTEEVRYAAGGAELVGYIAYPQGATGAPGILVVHEWWGHNDYVRQRADMLAELGYVAFALDMYGDGKTTDHPKEANAFMMEVVNNADIVQARFTQALDLLKNHNATDAEKMAAIGYCFGGSVVLSMARTGVDLDGVVSFHGSLGGLAPINKGEVEADFLVLNGAADPMVTQEQKQGFRQEMSQAELDFEFVDYRNAMHGFTNPRATELGQAYGLPLQYDPKADAESWERMQSFLQSVF